MVDAIVEEVALQKDYLKDKTLQSIYFGGGTPSLLDAQELDRIFEQINRFFTVSKSAEITLEANPDDLTPEMLEKLAGSPVNRLSIGIQSFHEADLKYMNRAHNSKQAMTCITDARRVGFDQISIDLIYGTPGLTNEGWLQNLNLAKSFNVEHLSSYALTVEEGTALEHFIRKGKAKPLNEAQAAEQFELLMNWAGQNGFEHYEISNFARDGQYAKHNTGYWKGKEYLGIGPSAHSYNFSYRQWNVANNAHYVKEIQEGRLVFEIEKLSNKDQFNEYLMTGLRTKWGCEVEKLKTFEFYDQAFISAKERCIKENWIKVENERIVLTQAGKLIGDHVISELFHS